MISSICAQDKPMNPECVMNRVVKDELWKSIDKIADASQRNELQITKILLRQNLALIIAGANTILLLTMLL